MGWDSNPRGVAPWRFSRPLPSTARPPIHRRHASRASRARAIGQDCAADVAVGWFLPTNSGSICPAPRLRCWTPRCCSAPRRCHPQSHSRLRPTSGPRRSRTTPSRRSPMRPINTIPHYTSGLRLGWTTATNAMPPTMLGLSRAIWGEGGTDRHHCEGLGCAVAQRAGDRASRRSHLTSAGRRNWRAQHRRAALTRRRRRHAAGLWAGPLDRADRAGVRQRFWPAAYPPGIKRLRCLCAPGPFVWYLFAGADGQAVAYDATLGGNALRSGPHVGRKWVVGEIDAEIGIIWRGVRIS